MVVERRERERSGGHPGPRQALSEVQCIVGLLPGPMPIPWSLGLTCLHEGRLGPGLVSLESGATGSWWWLRGGGPARCAGKEMGTGKAGLPASRDAMGGPARN